MKNAFLDVAKLDSLENVGLARKACKLAEETGELMQVVCRHVGMKSNQMTPEEMYEEAFGEVADVIQNCFCIANQFGLKEEEVPVLSYKTSKAKMKPEQLAKDAIKCFNKVAKVTEIVDGFIDGDLNKKFAKGKIKTRILFAIESTLIVARQLGIPFEEIEPKILEKNKKWMLRIEKKTLKKLNNKNKK